MPETEPFGFRIFKGMYLNFKKNHRSMGNSVHVNKSIIDTVAPELAFIFNICIDCGEIV